jgi:glycosyltransferase involved in cell wall biosynthesis
VSSGSLNRLVIVSNVFPPGAVGGAELVAEREARALAGLGWEVSVFAGDLHRDAAANGLVRREPLGEGKGHIYWVAVDAPGPVQNFYRPTIAEVFGSVLALTQPNVVHFHNLPVLGADLIQQARRAAEHVCVTLHDTWGFCLQQTMIRSNGQLCTNTRECAVCCSALPSPFGTQLPIRLRRDFILHCLSQADSLVTPSEFLRQSYLDVGLPAERIKRVSNGIDLARLPARLRRPRGTMHFLVASRLADHKGIPVLVDALDQLLENRAFRDRWRCTLVGQGPLSPAIEALSARSGGAVRFVPQVPSSAMPAFFSEADVVVLPSVCPENESVTLLEGLASGTALLATATGGTPEIISAGENGLLVQPNDPSELCGSLSTLIERPDLITSFSRANLDRRERYDPRRCIVKIQEVWRSERVQVVTESLVICAGECSDSVFEVVSDPDFLDPRLSTRLIWQDWADRETVRNADLLWIWGSPPPFLLLARILKQGTPVLAENSLADFFDTPEREMITFYRSLDEAVYLISRLKEQVIESTKLPPPLRGGRSS